MFFSRLDPASRQVETICLLSEMLEELLSMSDPQASRRSPDRPANDVMATPIAA